MVCNKFPLPFIQFILFASERFICLDHHYGSISCLCKFPLSSPPAKYSLHSFMAVVCPFAPTLLFFQTGLYFLAAMLSLLYLWSSNPVPLYTMGCQSPHLNSEMSRYLSVMCIKLSTPPSLVNTEFFVSGAGRWRYHGAHSSSMVLLSTGHITSH